MHLKVCKSPRQTVRCWHSLKRGVPIYLPTVDHLQGGRRFTTPLGLRRFTVYLCR
nr:MAG TPA: hypothetical protein [Caudoviricetes sp.]